MPNRITYIDLAKGICISIVMLFHIRGIASYELPFGPVLFYSFMLPPFFFIAGVFFKANIGFKEFLIKKTNYLSTDFACIIKALQNLPFLCLGYITNKFSTNLQKILRRKQLFLLLITSLAVASLPMLIQPLSSIMAGSIFYCLCGLAGSYFIISLSALINYLPLFNYLGHYSIIIVLTHGLIVCTGYPLFTRFSSCLGGYGFISLFWGIMALSYLAIIPLLRVTMPHVTAQKPIL